MKNVKELNDLTEQMPDYSVVNDLVGKELEDIRFHQEILMLRFEEFDLHISGFARIISGSEILSTTLDYHSWDEQDHKHNDMYRNVSRYGERIIGGKVRSVELSPVKDLMIDMDNGIRIEVYNSNGGLFFSGEREQWYLFKPEDEEFPAVWVCSEQSESIL